MIRFLSAFALFTFLAGASVVRAEECCRYVVEGCGKQQNVCTPGDCNAANRAKAKEAFEKSNKCSSSNDASYIRTCTGERCDLDLRKK